MKNGYVVYSEILFDDYGLVLEKNNISGFPWVLKEKEFAPKNLFEKQEIRTLIDENLIKSYIYKLLSYDLPINLNYICDINSEFKGKFLGYDYISRDMDYSPVYEAGFTEAFDSSFKNWTQSILNENLYIDNIETINEFLKKRNKIITSFCDENSILTDLKITDGLKSNVEEFIKVKIYRINISEFLKL